MLVITHTLLETEYEDDIELFQPYSNFDYDEIFEKAKEMADEHTCPRIEFSSGTNGNPHSMRNSRDDSLFIYFDENSARIIWLEPDELYTTEEEFLSEFISIYDSPVLGLNNYET